MFFFNEGFPYKDNHFIELTLGPIQVIIRLYSVEILDGKWAKYFNLCSCYNGANVEWHLLHCQCLGWAGGDHGVAVLV